MMWGLRRQRISPAKPRHEEHTESLRPAVVGVHRRAGAASRDAGRTAERDDQMQALYGPAPYGARHALRLLAIAAVLVLIAYAGAVLLAPS